ncbi:MAG: WG repeat-containing protein [Deltaproteobacteria bacterium]|nr:WG repeat-containing protein [Deltaproteobacteria bacterium]
MAATPPFLVLLSGCAIFSSNLTFTPVDGLSDVKISSRSTPAKISNESDKILETKGYAYIGFVRLEDEVKACWDKECQNFECTASLPHKDMTKEVLEKATAVGGDLLVLGSNAKPEISSTQKKGGPCIRSGDQYIQVPYCCKQGRGYCESTCYRTERRTVCLEQATIYGKKCSFITDGKVWRYDPELIKDLARIKWEKKYPRNFEVMKKAYEPRFQEDLKKGLSRVGPPAVKVGGKYGFQESVQSNKMIIKPQYTDVYYTWSEDLIAVSVGERDQQLWGFIDMTGKWVIRTSYQAAKNICDGVAAVRVNNKYGYIDKKGNLIIKPQFDVAWDFMQGIARIKVSNKKGYVNKAGEVFMEP